MLINIGELSMGMGKIFIREFMETGRLISCAEGQPLFHQGEAAHRFFTLIEGEFQLHIGNDEQFVYVIRLPGEIFGWSSLVGGITYSATAVCTQPSEILSFDREVLNELLNRFPGSGFVFYKKLARMLGFRLLESYRLILAKQASGIDHEAENLIMCS